MDDKVTRLGTNGFSGKLSLAWVKQHLVPVLKSGDGIGKIQV